MRVLRSVLAVALMAASSSPVMGQTLITGTFTGGSNFATTMTGTLTHLGSGILQLQIANGGPGVFTHVGIVNVPTSATAVTGTGAPTGWTFGAPDIGGDGLGKASGPTDKRTAWAYGAPPPPVKSGLQPPPSTGFATFTFDVGSRAYQNIGFAVRAQGVNGCSTKFGVWRDVAGQLVTNDFGPTGYDPGCVSVPEPGSMALLVTGLAGLAFVVARRREEDGIDTEPAA